MSHSNRKSPLDKARIETAECYAHIFNRYVIGESPPTIRAYCDLTYGIYGEKFEELFQQVRNELRLMGTNIDKPVERAVSLLRLLQLYTLCIQAGDSVAARETYKEMESVLGVRMVSESPVDEDATRWFRIQQRRGHVYCIRGINTLTTKSARHGI